MAGVDDVHFGIWHVPPVGIGFCYLEGRALAAPHHQQRWCVSRSHCCQIGWLATLVGSRETGRSGYRVGRPG
jgi:hypothetical protein